MTPDALAITLLIALFALGAVALALARGEERREQARGVAEWMHLRRRR